ncbi:hypothetical protein DBR06_SOUSAS11710048, partial [Sousa chinensis]
GFATHVTFVRFLSSVNSSVNLDVIPLLKGLATFKTLIWFLSRMTFLMVNQ